VNNPYFTQGDELLTSQGFTIETLNLLPLKDSYIVYVDAFLVLCGMYS